MSIDERFSAFADANPEVLQTLIDLARDAKGRGYKTYSLKALWEVLRFGFDPVTAERYKLSNDFTSRYSRLVMATAPDLRGFFVTKKLKDSDVGTELSSRDEDDLELEVDAQLMADGIW